jgi:capsular polysaccharide export protein
VQESPRSHPPQHVLFLQGMPSPFYRRIAEQLVACGCRVTRINLCAGDWMFWHGKDAISYRGSLSQWPGFMTRFMREQGVTDLVLLGEKRRYHREAVDIALARGVRVTVNDFGYLRPDWITFERNGMSGASLFPHESAAIRALAACLPEPDWAPRYVDSAYQMARADLAYNFANVLLGWLYPRYRRSDRRPPTLIYTPASALRLLSNRLVHKRMHALVDAMEQSGRTYFVFPLQLDFDFQIVAYSPFDGIAQAIERVLISFAQHAPANAHLVLKEHPWDPALHNWEHIMARRAAVLGISDRVHYLRGGYLDTLIRAAAGVVTINSTSGLRALQIGRPLVVLGQAVYDVPGLSFQCGLDAFWTQAECPDPRLVQDLLRAMAGTIQIRGVFFQEPGLSVAVDEAAKRLLENRVGQPTSKIN